MVDPHKLYGQEALAVLHRPDQANQRGRLSSVLDSNNIAWATTPGQSKAFGNGTRIVEQARVDQRNVPIAELRNRKMLLQKAITQIDTSVAHLMAVRSGIPSAIWIPKMQQIYAEVKSRKDLLPKVNQALAQASTQFDSDSDQSDNIGSSIGSSLAHPPSQSGLEQKPRPAPLLPHPTGQPQSVATDGKKVFTLDELTERRAILQQSIVQWETTGKQLLAARSGMAIEVFEPKMQQVQFEVTRRKGLMVKLNHAITHISAQPRPHDGLLVSSLILPPPLDKARFEIHYANFCRTKGLEMTSRVALSDAQWVDLYQLHVNVMKEGTFAKVNQNNLWHIVGGRLGYVRASDNTVDPPRCDPELAAQLSRIYKEHLEHFDFLYISSVVDMAKRKAEIQKQS